MSNVAERSCNMNCALTTGFCIVKVFGNLGKTLSVKWWDKILTGLGRREDEVEKWGQHAQLTL